MPCTQENTCSIYTELSHYTFVTSFKRNVMYTNILKNENENENIVRTLNTLCPVKPQCLECHISGLHLVLIQGLKKVPSCWASNFSLALWARDQAKMSAKDVLPWTDLSKASTLYNFRGSSELFFFFFKPCSSTRNSTKILQRKATNLCCGNGSIIHEISLLSSGDTPT